METKSFEQRLDETARNELAGKIRRLGLRLAEVEQLNLETADAAHLHGLEVAILLALADAFGQVSSAYRQFSPAGRLRVESSSPLSFVEQMRNAKKRAVALLQRAIQNKQEEFEDRFPGFELLMPSRQPSTPTSRRSKAGVQFLGLGGQPVAADGDIATILVSDDQPDVPRGNRRSPEMAFQTLAARVAVLEAALLASKQRPEPPMGIGHNGPPDYESPLSEADIQELVDLLKAQAPRTAVDLPKLQEVAKDLEKKTSRAKQFLDDFATAAVKGAGAEAGKRLAQMPFWLAVYGALDSVLQAAAIWISTLPH